LEKKHKAKVDFVKLDLWKINGKSQLKQCKHS